jgi:drug/metabolite transporter (DMT)-like permease
MAANTGASLWGLVPLFGAAFGVTLPGEPFLWRMAVGGAIAVMGVMPVPRP